MYIITNTATGDTLECDALSFFKVSGTEYVPAEQDEADGFEALVIIHVSAGEEYYERTSYALEGHELLHDEPIGIITEDEDIDAKEALAIITGGAE